MTFAVAIAKGRSHFCLGL